MRLQAQLNSPLGDGLLGLGCFAASAIHVLLTPDVERPTWLLIALATLTTLPLAWRRLYPLGSGGLIVAAFAALVVGDYPEFLVGSLVAVVVSLYSVGANVDDVRLSAAVLVAALVCGWADDVIRDHPFGQYLGTVITLAVPWVGGRLLRHHRRRESELRRLAAALEAERRQAERAAVAEERTRIARELHDAVAHSISVIGVQAAGAEAATPRELTAPRAALDHIQTAAREALFEMRRMLTLLRGEHDLGEQGKRLADLDELVRQAERAGTAVKAAVSIDADLSPALEMNAYRIVQEALTNVRKHAGPGASAEVAVTVDDGRLLIAIRDDGRGDAGAWDEDPTGHGLRGIRERVTVFGGRVAVGPRDGRGFELTAEIPIVPEGTPRVLASERR